MKELGKLAIIISCFLLTTTINPMKVNAEWIQRDEGWQYSKGETYLIGWNNVNDKWYYFDSDGIMQTWWINDGGKYYYLNDDGVLDESKTTNYMPEEIQAIYNIISIYNDSGMLKYVSRGHINKLELSHLSLYKFYSENQLKNDTCEYYYEPSNGNAYKFQQGVLVLLNTNTVISNTNVLLTVSDAVNRVKDYLLSVGENSPANIKVESDDVSKYLIHCYNDEKSGSFIDDWYYVDKYSGKVLEMYEKN